ncbi:hypothetical protein BJ165DRAFT_1530758 [Panaeolus papilionaceus]|nr:hypothetical protein BJ165DRAFT_1530758 [Panaeolus papilionaceus]
MTNNAGDVVPVRLSSFPVESVVAPIERAIAPPMLNLGILSIQEPMRLKAGLWDMRMADGKAEGLTANCNVPIPCVWGTVNLDILLQHPNGAFTSGKEASSQELDNGASSC